MLKLAGKSAKRATAISFTYALVLNPALMAARCCSVETCRRRIRALQARYHAGNAIHQWCPARGMQAVRGSAVAAKTSV
ncbi:hypothetical protein F5Y14DRAFT_428127 [Nemania sp. NC0429]|nr:hypothetical protein F5Y14DRAFT_428127 [Nemania sp. NC0429]